MQTVIQVPLKKSNESFLKERLLRYRVFVFSKIFQAVKTKLRMSSQHKNICMMAVKPYAR